jgi:HK97 family phage major capsid protein
MTTRNENLARADIAIDQLDTNGGLLQPEQANAFIDMILDEPTILPTVRVERMNAPEKKINRIGFGSRILRAARNAPGLGAEDDGSNGRYVRKAERAAPTTSQIVLRDSEVIAEVRIPYEVLEDNIEGQALEAHIMRLIAQQAAVDLEELFLWGDTALAGTDAYLGLQDGMLKRATSHVADNLGVGVSPDLFANAMLAMPQKYLRNLAQMKAWISVANTIRYRQRVAQRQTGYGDSALQNNIPLQAHGLTIEGAPMLAADNIGAMGLVTFPKNLIWGIRRDISVETAKDIRSREYIIVLTMRVATQIDDADAVVKLENI